MSDRFRWAVLATQNNDLVELAKYLAASVVEAAQEGYMPHMDPAVRLISFHIAFTGNGDRYFTPFYEECYKYCEQKAIQGPNAIFPKESELGTPLYKAS